MKVGKPFNGIRVQAPKNYSRGSHNLPVAQEAIDNTVARANRQYVEAINVDGVRYLHWSRALEGFACTCKRVKDEQTTGDGLNPDNSINDPTYSPSITDPWASLEVRSVNSKRQVRDDGTTPLPDGSVVGKVKDSEVDQRSFRVDHNTESLIDDSDDNTYFENILSALGNPFGASSAQCGICLDTGFVNGYKLSGGDRIIFDASGQMPVLEYAPFLIDKEKFPNRFTLPAGGPGHVSWVWEVPTYFKRALGVAVRNNVEPAKNMRLEYKPFQETANLWKPLTVEAIDSFAGNPTKIIIRVVSTSNSEYDTVEFTHVEITLQYKDWSKMQMPPLSENANEAIHESPIQSSVIVPPTQYTVKPKDFFYDYKYDKMWKVIDVTDGKTAKQQIFNWQVNLRLLLNTETAQVLRVARDPEFALSFAAMLPYQSPTFQKEDGINYVTEYQAAQQKARLLIRSITLSPQTGEYVLGTSKVIRNNLPDNYGDSGVTFLANTVNHFKTYYPNLKWIWLEPSWFGDDMRAAYCDIKPRVISKTDSCSVDWKVSGLDRAGVDANTTYNTKPAFNGTINDASLIEAIKFLKANGYKVGIKPKILMDIPVGNTLPPTNVDGNTPTTGQPAYEDASKITYTTLVNAESGALTFFGNVDVTDFADDTDTIDCLVPNEFSYRRFVFHYVNLCVKAGGVDGFIIGSCLPLLTLTAVSAVNNLLDIAQQTKLALNCLVSYEASMFEYGGQYSSVGPALSFPLDVLWADNSIDFVSIKFDAEWTDWRTDGQGDVANYTSLYDPTYLHYTLKGGINFDYVYADSTARTNGTKTLLNNWYRRVKDFLSWVSLTHTPFDNTGNLPNSLWEPYSKRIVITDMCVPAIDRGTNGPYISSPLRTDVKPYFSNSAIDDDIVRSAVFVFNSHWHSRVYNPDYKIVAPDMNNSGFFDIRYAGKPNVQYGVETRQLLNWRI